MMNDPMENIPALGVYYILGKNFVRPFTCLFSPNTHKTPIESYSDFTRSEKVIKFMEKKSSHTNEW